ncbi:MAG: hypothetical protein ABR540_14850, partial [Acidimicrobiales bacterium]
MKRLPARLERATGYPGWAVTGAVSGILLLGVAMIGLYWDVAWHVDYGRDKVLFTPPHSLILIALSGLIVVGLWTVALATAAEVDTGVRIGRWRAPWSALLLLVFRVGGLVAFVVDDLWHAAYGIDVTLWSPPHLGLLASGSGSAVALWLMLVEGSHTRPTKPTTLGRGLQL